MKIVWGILLSGIIAVICPSIYGPSIGCKDTVNTLFSVLGIIFSIGMSLIISASTFGIKHPDARAEFRHQLTYIRKQFIVVFVLSAIFYTFLPIEQDSACFSIMTFRNIKFIFSGSVFQVVSLLLGITYYVVNFNSIQDVIWQLEKNTNKNP